MDKIGLLIQKRLDEMNMTKTKLAELMGVTEGAIRKWQKDGLDNTKIERVKNLSKILSIPIPVLMGIEDEKFSGRTIAIARKFNKLNNDDKVTIENILKKY